MAAVILVHGAWHGAWCWDGVVDELKARDVPVVAVELPLLGIAADVAEAQLAIVDSGPGSVVVGHSYGGIIISEAGRDRPEVQHLVYLAAFMLDQSEDMATLMAEHGSELLGAVVPEAEGLMIDRDKVRHLFYGDSDERTAKAAAARLRPMMFGDGPPTGGPPAWKTVPSTYVRCTSDRALPPSLQQFMASRAGSIVDWPTDHSPFLTRPRDIAELAASRMAG